MKPVNPPVQPVNPPVNFYYTKLLKTKLGRSIYFDLARKDLDIDIEDVASSQKCSRVASPQKRPTHRRCIICPMNGTCDDIKDIYLR